MARKTRIAGVGVMFEHECMIPDEEGGEGGGVSFTSPSGSTLTIPVSIWELLGRPVRFIANLRAK